MKIKINEFETYNINISEEYTPQEFRELMSRLQYIEKLVGKDPLIKAAMENPSSLNDYTKPRDRPWNQSRESAIRYMKEYYASNKIQKEKVVAENNVPSTMYRQDMGTLRARYSIQPNEIGLIEFPGVGQSPIFLPQTQNGTKTNTEEEEEKEIQQEAFVD